jgi:hypothetical protein
MTTYDKSPTLGLNLPKGTDTFDYDVFLRQNFNTLDASLADMATNAKNFNTLADSVTQLNVGTNKILFLPDGTYSISSPLTISGDNIDVRLAPNAKIVSTVSNINTFIFTGKNCSLTGGTIEYPVAFDGTNRKWEDYEAVVLIKGDGFKGKNTTLNNVYKVGFGVRGASNCIIKENNINGNYPASSWTGVETAHFGIAIDPSIATGGQDIIINNNIIKSCVQGTFTGNYGSGIGYGINISNNVFDGCHNHGIYSINGIGSILNANNFNRCSLPIAAFGNYATITNNNIYTSQTGNNLDLVSISVRDATHCNVSGNTIKGDGASGGVIIDLTSINGSSIDNNIVSNNIIDISNSNSVIAIRVGNTTLTNVNSNNYVNHNIIRCNGTLNQGVISILTNASYMGKGNHVIGNTITMINNCYAIYVYKQRGVILSANTIKFEYSAAAAETITMVNAVSVEDSLYTQNILRCESTYGSNVTLRGIKEDSACTRSLVTGNIINLDPTLLVAKTETILVATSKASNNMIAGAYVA